MLANRTWERAVELAERVGGRAVRLLDVPDALVDVDVLLSSTGATAALLQVDDVRAIVDRREGRPLLIVDIAVPRDVDPAVGSIPGVTLLDMEDLALVRRRRTRCPPRRGRPPCRRSSTRSSTATSAPPPPARSRRWSSPCATGPRRSARPSSTGSGPGSTTSTTRRSRPSRALTRGIIGKLLHEPSVALKDAAGSPRGDRLVASLRELFGLDAEHREGPGSESVTGAPE